MDHAQDFFVALAFCLLPLPCEYNTVKFNKFIRLYCLKKRVLGHDLLVQGPILCDDFISGGGVWTNGSTLCHLMLAGCQIRKH